MNHVIHFLGTNGWYDTETGKTISILIDSRDWVLVLDAGNGFSELDSVARLDKPCCIVLSHLHLDHTGGLHILNKFHFEHGLKIFVPQGQQIFLEALLSSPFTINYRNLSFPVSLHELPASLPLLPCEAEILPLVHSVPTLGIRLSLDDSIVTYCPDTGFCSNAVILARNADFLIAECAFLPGEEDPEWPHLNPESAARIALEAQAKKLILVHFDAARYKTIEMRELALHAAKKTFPNTELARDGMALPIL
jgi:ribonuclease BN (tRNA processing enzyme)